MTDHHFGLVVGWLVGALGVGLFAFAAGWRGGFSDAREAIEACSKLMAAHAALSKLNGK